MEIKAHGNKAKIIKEFIGRVNSKTEQTSTAQMESPQGWEEPGQTPEFDECDNLGDDDGDGLVNDGCPAVGAPEVGADCANY